MGISSSSFLFFGSSQFLILRPFLIYTMAKTFSQLISKFILIIVALHFPAISGPENTILDDQTVLYASPPPPYVCPYPCLPLPTTTTSCPPPPWSPLPAVSPPPHLQAESTTHRLHPGTIRHQVDMCHITLHRGTLTMPLPLLTQFCLIFPFITSSLLCHRIFPQQLLTYQFY